MGRFGGIGVNVYSHLCNDGRKTVRGVDLGGSALRAGRFFFYLDWPKRNRATENLKVFWHFWHNLNWAEVCLRFGGEDAAVTLSVIVPWLAHVGIGIGLPISWLRWWMVEDRVFAIKLGYIGDIAWIPIAYAEHMEDGGMTDYYRRQKPRRYNDLQLWPGWEIKIRRPKVLTWIFGKAVSSKSTLDLKPVTFEMDGRIVEAIWTLERWDTWRPRWPWAYGTRFSSWLEVHDPPKFAGKGENSWDCDDDGIYGMGSSELTPAGTVGDYLKQVLNYRERYGLPRDSSR
jgi:hypothetical protein